ncbi:hypothetical protein LSH36_530g03046 [Paralvinella palmiformis]|uniref:Uncharacterized protein n=1 Tax=Paralvinella palmiformis TaxID=53620 RepID=A0AAD9J7J8_9ANNE|nr:hypothetical protein LSH36_530g03046 [Paralvinella palmiformis]
MYLFVFISSQFTPACKSQMDGVLFLFSFIDKTSFDDLPHQISRILDVEDNVCKFVIGREYPLFLLNSSGHKLLTSL